MSDSEVELQDAAVPTGSRTASPASPGPEPPQSIGPTGAPEVAEVAAPAAPVAGSAPPRRLRSRSREVPLAHGVLSAAAPLAAVAAADIRAELERRALRTRRLLAERERLVAAIAELDAQLAALQRDLQCRRAPAARAARRGTQRRAR